MPILSFQDACKPSEGTYKGVELFLTTKNTIEHLKLTVYKIKMGNKNIFA